MNEDHAEVVREVTKGRELSEVWLGKRQPRVWVSIADEGVSSEAFRAFGSQTEELMFEIGDYAPGTVILVFGPAPPEAAELEGRGEVPQDLPSLG